MRGFGAVIVAALLLAACGGGGEDEPDAASPASGSEVEEAFDATLLVRDEAATHRPDGEPTFGPAEDGQELAVGDTLRTNGTGFVQVDYLDGSFVRLDADAEFTLTELASEGDVQTVEGSLDVGRAWSNVQELTEAEDGYEITTPVATAAVRGTLFNIDCTADDGSCSFVVVEGVVVVTPNGGAPVELRAGDSLTVRADGTTTTNPVVTLDRLRADPWIQKNLDLDEEETGETPTELPEQAPDEELSASLDGTWTVARTVSASTNPLQPVGSTSEVQWVLTSTCSTVGCSVHLEAQGSFGAFQRGDLAFADGRFEGPITGESPCTDPNGNQLSVSPITGTAVVIPGADGTFTGRVDAVLGESPGCPHRTTTFELAGRKG